MTAFGHRRKRAELPTRVEISYSALVGKCCWRDPAPPDNNYEFRLSGRCGRDMLDASSGAEAEVGNAPLSNSDICGSAGDDRNAGSTARSRRRRRHAHRRQGEQGQGTPAPAKKNTTQATRSIDNLHRNWKAKRAMMALTSRGQSLATLGWRDGFVCRTYGWPRIRSEIFSSLQSATITSTRR